MAVVSTIRFLIGAALVAAGVTLVAPLAQNLAAAVAGGEAGCRQPNVLAPAPAATAPAAALEHGGQHDPWEAPPADRAAVADPWAGASNIPALDSAGGLQLDRCPPPPPGPLPPPPGDLARATPGLGAAYRSTLHVPPPPLLDATGPPPSVAWAAVAAAATPAPAAPVVGEITVPATYRVRDGDDLNAIANRFYGNPGAASAIWAANRDAMERPDLLPIGAELRLPPPWAVGRRQQSSGAIEPVSYARPVEAAPGPKPGVPAALPWLGPVVENALPPPAPAAVDSPPPGQVAGSVRVGAGETLPSLAQRLYADPAMAAQIFAVNRDRLRSPDLVVPGMELRLPRPVTAPRP